MRPIERGPSPISGDYSDYRDAFGDLQSRLGPYCSYCERRIPTQLAVEHIQPKGLPQYAHLIGRWDNYLLGCTNCNGTKKDKNVTLQDHLLPDRDNTAAAYEYTSDGKIAPAPGLSPLLTQMALRTLALCGLEKTPKQILDSNGQAVAAERESQRKEVWAIAQTCVQDLQSQPTEETRRAIVKTAQGHGLFSIWMKVFEKDPQMRVLLIEGFSQGSLFFGFPGTARSCFHPDTTYVTPRPNNGLAHGGKT